MNNWIQKALKKSKKGSFRRYVKKKYGEKGFVNGRIRMSVINKEVKNKNPKISRKAVLARTLRRFSRN